MLFFFLFVCFEVISILSLSAWALAEASVGAWTFSLPSNH